MKDIRRPSKTTGKLILEQYTKRSKLSYLYEEYRYIVEQFVSEQVPIQVGDKLAELYIYWRSIIIDEKSANQRVKAAFEIVKMTKQINKASSQILKKLEAHFNASEQKEREERYERVELKRRQNVKEKISQKEIDETTQIFQDFRKELNFFLCNPRFEKKPWSHFVHCNIQREEIDETVGTLAQICRYLLQPYLFLTFKSSSFWWKYRDAEYWSKDWWKLRYDYLEETPHPVGYIYILSNEYMPGLVKIGKSIDPETRAEQLTTQKGSEGVPGHFNVEYARETALLKTYKNLTIEKVIHRNLRIKLRADGSKDSHNLIDKEFFIVPSVKYAILFVEEQIDIFEKFLARMKWEKR